MSTQHQAKRPYAGSQPSITSYLIQSPSTVSPMTTYSISNFPPISSSSAPARDDIRSPPLPPSVQANLLSVGMRVRKSVPEGYKTGTAFSAFTLFSDSATPTPVSRIQEPRSRRAAQRPRAAELAPFCGIMKVGGLAQQQSAWEVCDTEMNSSAIMEDEEDEDDVPVLSQGSTNSDASVASRGVGKRRFELDEDDIIDDRDLVAMSAGRIIAVPRRKGAAAAKAAGQVHIVGQENAEDLDFGDADFLDYGLVDEVEMAGV